MMKLRDKVYPRLNNLVTRNILHNYSLSNNNAVYFLTNVFKLENSFFFIILHVSKRSQTNQTKRKYNKNSFRKLT